MPKVTVPEGRPGLAPGAHLVEPAPFPTAADLPDPRGPLGTPTRLRFEHLPPGDALGIATATPRLSFDVPSAPAGWQLASVTVEVTCGPIGGEASTTTHTLPNAATLHLPWPDEPLALREAATVRVRVSGTSDEGEVTSPWSDPISVETGILAAEDWQALPVGPSWPENPDADRRPSRVRHAFDLPGDITAARLRVSVHGLIRPWLNGERVDDDELVPGWTVYGERLLHRSYDVTDLLAAGANVLAAELADGWYRGHIGFDGGYRNLYGADQAAILQLEVVHGDGSLTVVATDDAWQVGGGPILFTGLYEGETYDARLADDDPTAWARPGEPCGTWLPVAVHPSDAARLEAPLDAPVQTQGELTPVAIWLSPAPERFLPPGIEADDPDVWLVDFGQNIAGRLRFVLPDGTPAGTTIRIRHAEVLENGRLGVRPLRGAAATDTYTTRGDAGEEWEPAFTIHGFRYAEITGWPGEPEPDALRAVVLHTTMERLGGFASSEPLVDRLHENSRWSMTGNFVALPTDCPQRDERLGWTGDVAAFAPTAAFHYDATGLLASWLVDLWLEQQAHGTVTWYVPVIPGGFWTPPRPAAVWGDAATITPWTLYETTGDRRLLEDQWESARQWVDLVDSLAGEGHVWDSGMQLGDWLDPSAPPENPMQAMTDPYLVATAYFAQSARIVARWAAALGKEAEASRYGELADAIAAAFRDAYLQPDGRLSSDSQTAYALAIVCDVLGEDDRVRAGEHLARKVAESEGRVATGFAGTPVVCAALTATGQDAVASALLLETGCPSWLYAVTMGATTTWERWDSMLPDGSINPGEMTSFNHYALGAVAAWLQRDVAGLAPAAPGYAEILVAPHPVGLTHAEAVHVTPYGPAASSWSVSDGVLTLDVVVPVGATARVVLGGEETVVAHGRHTFTAPSPA
ncbi:family 78 glycoside hydrolase catalytic domain [Propioniciclava soli]|uniref:alpha-L-rhamnosidase n=1 Tax=Propioniciclava soli TaxID=2775081 RepID=A0ABZ3C5Q7_9ACTN